MALETSPEAPVPVRTVAHLIGQWIGRLGKVWVEGQITQLVQRPGASTNFLTLRDPVADVSLQVTCSRRLLAATTPITEGARVLVFGRPTYYVPRGSLSFAAEAIRPVGIGDLLARIEHLRRVLAAEGLFEDRRKRPVPFLPRRIGLICGRASAAERDVRENARRRWPAADFVVREVAVQGPYAVAEILAALAELDADAAVEVIVLARGGGSVEDLLPFSDETLLRAVAAARTPVVSAIGHEQDCPLLDSVADVRASTPTAAAALIVPDLIEERAGVAALSRRASQAMRARLDREHAIVTALRSRPALAAPARVLDGHADHIAALRARAERSLRHRLERATDDLTHRHERVRALSPLATLERGYAIVQATDGRIVRAPADAPSGTELLLRLAGGSLTATAGSAADPDTSASKV